MNMKALLVFAALISQAVASVEGDEFQMLSADIERVSAFAKVAGETYRPEALVTKADRDPLDIVLRRTRALLEDIIKMSDAPDMTSFSARYEKLKDGAALLAPERLEERRALFDEACALRREIAFSNPLLNFDKILFIKRNRAHFNHMCDQYYGAYADPGGGLFALKNPFSDQAEAVDLLKDSAVESGRLAGSKLAGGGFLSPELSYDGKSVMFAYVEGEGSKKHIRHLDHANEGHWERGRCYHLFSAAIDPEAAQASNLKQLTDGTFNDFDPCFLPNGRVAFISERRGGYLRCGRACPSYTVHNYAFWNYGDHYRTIPGKFGARASKLYQLLAAGHHEVSLSEEEMHRITVWLDSVSNFYGVYEKAGGEAQLRGEIVQPTLQ